MINKQLVDYFKRKIFKNINLSANKLLKDARKNGYKFSDATAREYINIIKDRRTKGQKIKITDFGPQSKKTKFMRAEYIKIIEKYDGNGRVVKREQMDERSYGNIEFYVGQDVKKVAIQYSKKIEKDINKRKRNYYIFVYFYRILNIVDTKAELYKKMFGKK